MENPFPLQLAFQVAPFFLSPSKCIKGKCWPNKSDKLFKCPSSSEICQTPFSGDTTIKLHFFLHYKLTHTRAEFIFGIKVRSSKVQRSVTPCFVSPQKLSFHIPFWSKIIPSFGTLFPSMHTQNCSTNVAQCSQFFSTHMVFATLRDRIIERLAAGHGDKWNLAHLLPVAMNMPWTKAWQSDESVLTVQRLIL